MSLEKKMLINGEWVNEVGSNKIEIFNPANGEIIATVPRAEIEDVENAVDAAYEAFKVWSKLTPFTRGRILRKASDLVFERAKSIARCMTQEQGKPFSEALSEVEKGAEILKYYAEEGERVFGRIIANSVDGCESRVIYQPIGVAVAISPWNYPIELLAWKLGGALASGCSIVCKLPSDSPISGYEFIKCIVDAGICKGAVNAITGSASIVGPKLLKNPKVKKVAFTGSTAVGKKVLADCVDTLKKVSLELGGSLPMLVFNDCDLDSAVAGATRRSFRNNGQVCISVNRIYVQRDIYNEFLNKFEESTKNLTIGNGLVGCPDLGPMCNANGIKVVKNHIRDGIEKGARLLCGGEKPKGEEYKNGNFIEPAILADVNHNMLVMIEETFGPLVGVMPFDSVEEAIELANDTVYGLAAIVFTNDLNVSQKCILEIDSGNVAINNPDPGAINAPYGGWKDSGFGHEHGPEGLYEYLNVKHVRMKFQ